MINYLSFQLNKSMHQFHANTPKQALHRPSHHLTQCGFSLVEMAVVVVILGLVLGTLLLPIEAQRSVALRTQTNDVLSTAQKALISFAQTQGRLPCPATAASFGVESPVGGGACSVYHGFLPAATLSMQPVNAQGFAVDGWNNPIHYAVTSVNHAGTPPNTPDFTTSNKMRDVGIAQLAPDLSVYTDANRLSAGQFLSNNAIAVIFSTGANLNRAMGPDETANLNATNVFFSRTPTTNSENTTEFDDVMVWISPYIFYHHLLEAGQF